MPLPYDERRPALADWLVSARDALDRKDWRAAFTGYPALNLTEESVPWTPAPSDLRGATLTLLGSAGIYAPGQPPFDSASSYGDATWRALPVDLALDTTGIAHSHYDNSAALEDRNVVYPLDRLRELVASGELGGLTSLHFSFMGYIPDWRQVVDTLVPALVEQVVAQRPDAAVLVPV